MERLRVAIQTALSEGRFFPGPGNQTKYTVTYNERLARYEFKAFAQRFGYQFTIFSKHDQEAGGPEVPSIQEDGNGAWRLLGMVNGVSLTNDNTEDIALPGNDAPNLQYATQLFIKTDLGISARPVGPMGESILPASCCHRCPNLRACGR